MFILRFFKNWYSNYKKEQEFKRKIKKLKEMDPFIYD